MKNKNTLTDDLSRNASHNVDEKNSVLDQKDLSTYVLSELMIFTDKTIKDISWAYDHPSTLLLKHIYSRFLKFFSSLRFVIPEKQRMRFRHSADKRSGKYYLAKWKRKKQKLFGSAYTDIRFPYTQKNVNDANCSVNAKDNSSLISAISAVMQVTNPRKILVSDYRIPRPDVSAGEKATVGILNDLVQLGYDVTFVPSNMADSKPYRDLVRNLGVKVITNDDGYNSLSEYIEKECRDVGTFYFIRVDVAEKGLISASRIAPFAKIVFHAPDLYFLRETREAKLSGDPKKIAKANETRKRELAMMQLSDHIVVVSPAEVPVLRQYLPNSSIGVLPALYIPVVKHVEPYDKRKDIFFLGGFAHTPNVDSVLWFAEEVWPLIHKKLPDVQFHILGAEAPDKVKALGKKPGIQYVGFVEKLNPVLKKYRLGVAPLRYGAGIKGKVAMTMGAGIPCICTTIASEGMDLKNNEDTFIADNPYDFSEAVVKLYQNPELWQRFSNNGQKLVQRKFSEPANRADLLNNLEQAKALPVDLYFDYIKSCAPAAFPAYGKDTDIDVSIIIPVYNKWELTEDCLKSILQSCYTSSIKYEVILADDHSSDKTTQAGDIFPNIHVVRTKGNLGFLLNCNNAAKTARGRYLLFLNNDTIVFPNWLQSLFNAMEEDHTIGLAGSKLLYPDGTIQEAGGRIFFDGSAANMAHGEPRYYPEALIKKDVGYISGTSILVRKELWDFLGGFDEQYQPAYCEDSDMALAIWNLGFCVKYIPDSEVVHFEHASYSEEKSISPQERQKVNKEKLFKKWKDTLKNVDYFAADPERIKQFKEKYKGFLNKKSKKTRSIKSN